MKGKHKEMRKSNAEKSSACQQNSNPSYFIKNYEVCRIDRFNPGYSRINRYESLKVYKDC